MRGIARLVVIFVLVLTASASALPGDPPVTALSPADGATLQITPGGPIVGLGCPTFRDSDFGYPYTTYGYASSYHVTASPSSAVGADGLLSDVTEDTGVALDGEESEMSTCHATLEKLQSPGTWFWQPWRACTDCDNGKEVGPVRSFTLAADPDAVKLTIEPPARAYAGIGALVAITVDGATGPAITLQRLDGRRWVTVPSANALRFTDDHVARFPAGTYPVRAQITLPQTGTVTSPEVRVRVLNARTGAPHASGTYAADDYDLSASVVHGGRQLKHFKATITASCPIPAPGGGTNLNPRPLSVALPTIRIAPDGRFAYALNAKGYRIGISGRVHGGRLTGGVTGDTGPCAGSIRAFDARRR